MSTSSARAKTIRSGVRTLQSATLESLNRRIQRRCEERGDEDPREDVPCEQQEEQRQADEHGDAEHEKDRPRAYGNDTDIGGRHVR